MLSDFAYMENIRNTVAYQQTKNDKFVIKNKKIKWPPTTNFPISSSIVLGLGGNIFTEHFDRLGLKIPNFSRFYWTVSTNENPG